MSSGRQREPLSVDGMTAFACSLEVGYGPVAEVWPQSDLLPQWGNRRAREALEIEDRGNPERVGS